jgi:hypothetical protein
MPPARPEVARGALRGARAGVLATVALALAATAHAVGGGSLPSLPLLALVVVPLTWGAVVLTVRPLGSIALTVALGASQLVLHEALMVLSAPACAVAAAGSASEGMATAGMAGSMLGMPGTHAAASPVLGTCATGLTHGMGAMAGGSAAVASGAVMLLAHAVATILTALLLARGERALALLLVVLDILATPLRRAVAELVATVVAASRLARSTPRPPTPRADAWRGVVRLVSAVLESVGGRRAPPRLAAAA